MATYVNNLRLKEITTGDEDGTWGTSTNTNLELITDGFSYGTKEMAADANETFTMPDATADDTRSFYLKITSAVSLTATREVTLGPNTVSKVWMIENATSGSQIITIKQGSGATVNVPNGSKVMVVTDGAGAGAAVLNANPTEVGGTVTSVSGTGTVNGISLSGTVTSSGNLTLGGTLANVDLTSQITGTLPIANGGTGATSAAGALTNLGLTATATELNYTAGVTSAIQTQIDGKEPADATILKDADIGVTVQGYDADTAKYDDTTANFTGTLQNGGSNVVVDSDIGGTVGYPNIPYVTDKTTSYTLATGDVGKVVGVGSGGSITIPDATFSAGDAVVLFNNTSSDVTVTCSITTAYIAGTNSDVASVTLATRGTATVLFISSTVCVISGNVT